MKTPINRCQPLKSFQRSLEVTLQVFSTPCENASPNGCVKNWPSVWTLKVTIKKQQRHSPLLHPSNRLSNIHEGPARRRPRGTRCARSRDSGCWGKAALSLGSPGGAFKGRAQASLLCKSQRERSAWSCKSTGAGLAHQMGIAARQRTALDS